MGRIRETMIKPGEYPEDRRMPAQFRSLTSDLAQAAPNWEGEPLESYEKTLKFIRTTTTEAGLTVRAILNTKEYPKGVKASEEELAAVSMRRHRRMPKWNYTITPRP